MNLMLKFIFLFSIITSSFLVFAQSQSELNKIDSLKIVLNNKKNTNLLKEKIANEIAFAYSNFNVDSSKNYIDIALKFNKQTKSIEEEANAYKFLSNYYYSKGNVEESINSVEKSIQLYKRINNEIGLANALNSYGFILKSYGSYEEALLKFNESLEIAIKLNLSNNISVVCNNIGAIKNYQGKSEEALEYFRKTLEVEKTNQNKNTIASTYTNIALVYQSKDENDTALYYNNKSLELFKELNDTKKIVGCLNNIGNINRIRARYSEALKSFNLALEYLSKNESNRLKAITLINMSNIYINLKEHDKAIENYQKAAELLKDIDKYSYAASLSNIALIYDEQGKFEQAVELLNIALEIYLSQNSINYIIGVYNNLGSINLKQKNYEKALFYFKEAEKLNPNFDSKFSANYTYFGLAKIDFIKGDYNSALKNAEISYNMANEISALLEQSDAAKLMSDIFKKQNKYKEALEYFEIHKSLSDSITDSEKNRELGRVEAEAEYKRLEETLILENKNKILEKEVELTNQKYYLMILSLSFVALVIVVILLLILKKNREKTNAILLEKQLRTEEANNELQELHLQKNKLFSIIAHDLRGPLNTLSWFFNMALEGKLTQDEINALLPEVNKNVVNTTLLTENLLDWASKSMNEYNKEKQQVNLYKNLEDKKELFETSLKNKSIEFINMVNPDTEIYIDKNALELILRNLISNSIKYCREGDKIEVAESKKNGFSKICIKDTGVGMDEIQSRKLFNSEGVGSLKGTNDETGSGIGLMLCKSFIIENGGSIWVEKSEVGKGTTICFKIPLKV
jgi:signal transduction histidine kinase/TPR repeat protein